MLALIAGLPLAASAIGMMIEWHDFLIAMAAALGDRQWDAFRCTLFVSW
jgi:hypothetical protein